MKTRAFREWAPKLREMRSFNLTKVVLTLCTIKTVHSVNALVKKKISKNDSFLRFSANFQDFFKIQKIRNLKLIASQLFGVSQSSHRSYLLVKSHSWCFLDSQNSCYFGCPKNTKNAILRASMICVMIAILQKVDLQ